MLQREVSGPIGRTGMRAWDFGDVPGEQRVKHGETTVAVHPAIVDEGASVSIVACINEQRAARLSHAGVRRLFWLAAKDELKFQLRQLPGVESARLHYTVLTRGEDFDEQIGLLIAERAFMLGSHVVRTQKEFESGVEEGFGRIWQAGEEVMGVVRETLKWAQQVQLALDEARATHWQAALADMREQFAAMIWKGFLANTQRERLMELPRYFRAMLRRIEKLGRGGAAGAARDAEQMEQVRPLWLAYLQERRRRGESADDDARLEGYRWMLEEYRISLFAQDVGTMQQVSAKRLAKAWAAIVEGGSE
jgi:ATP-dependent helicase HrpA